MSEIINNSKVRIETLKKLILEIHNGVSAEETKAKLSEMFGTIPYGEVVQAEQELIAEGLPAEEILKYCDLHSDALKGNVNLDSAKEVPTGHPVHTFVQENVQIAKQIDAMRLYKIQLQRGDIDSAAIDKIILSIRTTLNNLMDVEKHYVRKENLLFPFLEKYEITGPPMVMWGKHDEARGFLKSSIKVFDTTEKLGKEEILSFYEFLFDQTLNSISEMIYKEEKILFPMCMDILNDIDWYEVYRQTDAIGYCLYDPQVEWKPEIEIPTQQKKNEENRVQLSTGAFTIEELEAVFSSLPVDLTFVDKDDMVKYFSHGKDRIFERSRAILGRKVQFCHPPSSVHIVERILNDFRSGAQSEAKFWINFRGKYVHIAYYAVRGANGEYLGTLEVTQDINQFRKVEGERRLLAYDK